ncbi:MAG: hypothetical protein ABEJ87_00165 [Candidatus Nanohalobium sp.]
MSRFTAVSLGKASALLVLLVLMASFSLAGKISDSTYLNRIDSCTGYCTTSDSMSTLTAGSTSHLDTGWTGFCGTVWAQEHYYIPYSADKMKFDISLDTSYWGAGGDIVIADGESTRTIFSRDPSGGQEDYYGTFTESMSRYRGEYIDVRYVISDLSQDWCNMFDHDVQYTASSSLVTTNNAPDTPSSLRPYWSGVSTRPYIGAYYSDPEGSYGSLKFYTGGGSYIGSCSTGSGSRCSVYYSGASSSCTNYDFRVKADDGSKTSSFSYTQNFKTGGCNSPPYTPSSLDPSGSGVSVSPNLDAYYNDPDSDDGTLYFQSSGGSSIGSCSTYSGSSCSVNWGSANNYGTSYSFDVYAQDNNGANSGTNSQSFKTNSRPSVSNLRPSNTKISYSPTLKADVSDPDGDSLTARFFLDGSHVGTDMVSGSGTARYSTSDLSSSQHSFHVKVSDGSVSDTSGTSTFIINHAPSVRDVSVDPLGQGHAVKFRAVVKDQDGNDQISSCQLKVTGGSGGSKTYSMTPEPGSTSKKAICKVSRIDQTDADWSHLEDLNMDFTVTDDEGATDSSSATATLPNHKPKVESIDVTDYPDRNAFRVSAPIKYMDNDTSEIRSCTVVLDNGDQSYSAGHLEKVGSTLKCVQENIGPDRFSGLSLDDAITIKVRATDIHGATRQKKTLYNVPSKLKYDYSAVVLRSGSVQFLKYRAVNKAGIKSKYRTTIEGVNATFTSNGKSQIEYNLSSGETRKFSIKVIPESGETTKKQLKVVTKNLDTGLEKTKKITVGIVDAGTPSSRPVPGPGLIQLLFLLAAASYVFWNGKAP